MIQQLICMSRIFINFRRINLNLYTVISSIVVIEYLWIFRYIIIDFKKVSSSPLNINYMRFEINDAMKIFLDYFKNT
ncbi:LOW QUALITY PROTEIN: hypothetical protein HZS_4986 [Henneguya salminicola]|nr:LOW QUALITY PROTEIN: hypothetical protein HZS_4986 [Henneguya salminicola]